MLLCKPIVVKGIIKPDVHHCRVMLKRCNAEKCNIELAEAPSVYVEDKRRNLGISNKKSNQTRSFKKGEDRNLTYAQYENEQNYFFGK